MKNFMLTTLVLILTTATAAAKQPTDIKKVKSIICQALVRYEEETPEKRNPTHGILIFNAGTRENVKTSESPFLLTEYMMMENNRLQEFPNQQYYFSKIKDGKIQFEFTAGWKAWGELNLNADGSITGYINQKSHIQELACFLKEQ